MAPKLRLVVGGACDLEKRGRVPMHPARLAERRRRLLRARWRLRVDAALTQKERRELAEAEEDPDYFGLA